VPAILPEMKWQARDYYPNRERERERERERLLSLEPMEPVSHLIIRLDKEFTDKLVEGTDTKAKVPQMLSVDLQVGISINNYGYSCLNRILL
jgi:hypothetical protein